MCPLQLEEIRLLAQVGFLAASRGNAEAARLIFEALEKCRPAARFPYMGMAMAEIFRRRQDDAVSTLDRGIAAVVETELAPLHALRALALHLAGRASECERALRLAGNHPMALALATQPRAA